MSISVFAALIGYGWDGEEEMSRGASRPVVLFFITECYHGDETPLPIHSIQLM